MKTVVGTEIRTKIEHTQRQVPGRQAEKLRYRDRT